MRCATLSVVCVSARSVASWRCRRAIVRSVAFRPAWMSWTSTCSARDRSERREPLDRLLDVRARDLQHQVGARRVYPCVDACTERGIAAERRGDPQRALDAVGDAVAASARAARGRAVALHAAGRRLGASELRGVAVRWRCRGCRAVAVLRAGAQRRPASLRRGSLLVGRVKTIARGDRRCDRQRDDERAAPGEAAACGGVVSRPRSAGRARAARAVRSARAAQLGDQITLRH